MKQENVGKMRRGKVVEQHLYGTNKRNSPKAQANN